MSKKGPLFILEQPGEKTKFADVLKGISVQSAVLEDAKNAFNTVCGTATATAFGELEGNPVIRKTGKFGLYVTWKGHTVSCKDEDTLETLTERLMSTISPDAVDHSVGMFRIKRGPYGLFMFKTGGRGKPTFVNIPADTKYTSLTLEGAEALYRSSSAAKKTRTTKQKSINDL